jgi:predicted transglutaminase-like cysteine proteinase
MGLSIHSRALRAFAFACGLSWCGPTAELGATTLLSPGPGILIGRSIEPFGLATTILFGGSLHEKWRGVRHRLDDELVQLALCDGDREGCVSPAALKFLAIIDAAKAREGRARLGEVNRAINLAIKSMSDLALHGQIDLWSSPLATLTKGAGDCEDYAIAKYVALRLAGVAADDLRIVVMHDTINGEDHAVAAARLDGHWLTLDNRRMAMIEDSDIRTQRPTFVIDRDSVMQYLDRQLPAEAASHVTHGGEPSSVAAPGPVASSN